MTTEKETFVINKICKIHNIDINNMQTSTEHNIMCAIRDTYLFVNQLHDEEIQELKNRLNISIEYKNNLEKDFEKLINKCDYKDKEIIKLKDELAIYETSQVYDKDEEMDKLQNEIKQLKKQLKFTDFNSLLNIGELSLKCIIDISEKSISIIKEKDKEIIKLKEEIKKLNDLLSYEMM